MIDTHEFDAIIKNAMNGYVNECKCDTPEDIGNAMMMLIGMCGLLMCSTVGQPEAVNRMKALTDYIASNNFSRERAN